MTIGRSLLLTAVLGVALATPAVAVAQTGPPATEDPAEAAAGWLASQLVDGERFETEFNGARFPDQGLTADAVLAFDAADVAQEFAGRATTWLGRADILAGYLGDGTAESYAGPHAKLALVAIAQGQDPSAFGGVDLISRLQELQAESGRFSDRSQFGDFSNAITQSLAIISLVRAGEEVAAAADYLATSQCQDGGFPLQFEQPTCTSEADATGFATQAMLAAGRTLDANEALDYLEAAQRDGGGFGGSGPTAGINANSTALAAQALRVGGRDAAADAAVGYLAGLQVGCAGPVEQRGAIAYDENGFDPANVNRATAQAVTGLVGVGLVDLDNAGDAAAAPVLACAVPTSTSATTTTITTVTTTSVAGGPAPGAQLPATGVPARPALGIGALLVLAGAALLVLAGRRGYGAETRP